MSGTIFLEDDEAWPVSGWLYRWVIEDLRAANLSAEGQGQLDEALAVQALDLGEFTSADRNLVLDALDEGQIQRFSVGLKPDFDAGPAIETLRELHSLAAKAAR